MQASSDAIAVYCFAFLILVVYTADTVVQWHTPQNRSWKYLLIQSFVIVAFLSTEVVLVILCQEKSMLYGLQGLSLLQSLIIEAMVSSRLHLGTEPFHLGFSWRRQFPWLHVGRCFPWALSCICLVALIFGCVAFASILEGTHNDISRVFIATVVVTAHGFLACFSLRELHNGAFDYHAYIAVFCVLCLNFTLLPASVLVSPCPSITTFLLAETSLSFFSNVFWVSLMLYNFEFKRRSKTKLQDMPYLSISSEGGEDKSAVLNDFTH